MSIKNKKFQFSMASTESGTTIGFEGNGVDVKALENLVYKIPIQIQKKISVWIINPYVVGIPGVLENVVCILYGDKT